nr:embryogenesis-associated protein EMB8-like [Tanacetum cinerariifolium]
MFYLKLFSLDVLYLEAFFPVDGNNMVPRVVPIVIVIPGLTSDSDSAYIKYIAYNMAKHGYNVVISNHRGLGGVSLTSDCFYTGGWTEDLREIVNHLHSTQPEAPLLAIGTSLGANILVKYLGEDGTNAPIDGAASICNPWDLLMGTRLSMLVSQIGKALKRDTIQLENAVSTISQEYLLEFTSEYGIPESLHPELPGFLLWTFLRAKSVFTPSFLSLQTFRTSTPKDQMLSVGSYSATNVTILNTRCTPIQKQLEALLCLVGVSWRYFLGDDVYPTFLYDEDRDMNLFSLISAPNPAKVKTGTRPRAAHEVPLMTATANRVIDMEDMTGASGSSGTPSTVEKSQLDFSNEDPPSLITERIRTKEQGQNESSQGISPIENPPGLDKTAANAPPKVLRKDHVASHLSQSTLEGKSLAAMGIATGSTVSVPATQETPVHAKGMSDLDPLSYANPPPAPEQDIAQKPVVTEDPDSEKSTSFTSMVGSPGGIYQPGQYNTTLAQQVVIGSQLRLRFKQETKLLKKAVAQVARRDPRIQAREKDIKELEALLEAEADMKDIAEAKNVELVKELESLHFKKYEDDWVSSRCAKMDALSIDFNEELYPYMLTTIAGHRWVFGHGLRLAVMKCAESTELRQVFVDVVSARITKGMSEGLKHVVEHRKAKVDLAAIEAHDPEVDTKYVTALHALKDLKYPLVDQLEKLKDAPIDVIMSSLYLESDSEEDTPQEEILLEDAIAANISRSKKKKKCRVVCRTHGVGSTYHVRSDGIPVSIPTIAAQGLAILLAGVATQIDITKDEASPKLLRSKSLPPMYNLDQPLYRLWVLPASDQAFPIHSMTCLITTINKVSSRSSLLLRMASTTAMRYVGILISMGYEEVQFLFPLPRRALIPSPKLRFALSTSPLDCRCFTKGIRFLVFTSWDLAYGNVSKATDQALGLLKVNFVPSGFVSISPTPDPSKHDDPSVNSVYSSCEVSITDASGGASFGLSTRKSARI